MMDINKYNRKTFTTQAVRVTEANMAEVAAWCQGEIRQTNDKIPRSYIYVRILRPLKERQCMAFVGDWVLHAGTGYKVYTNKAFRECFEEAPVPKKTAFEKYQQVGLEHDFEDLGLTACS
jgi:hypothetical protein